MELAEVVSLFAATNSTMVPAYATATGRMRHDHPRLAARNSRNPESAATPERKQATCQLVSAVALIAAPPVEKSSAAPRISRRLRVVATASAPERRLTQRRGDAESSRRLSASLRLCVRCGCCCLLGLR